MKSWKEKHDYIIKCKPHLDSKVASYLVSHSQTLLPARVWLRETTSYLLSTKQESRIDENKNDRQTSQ